MRTKITLMLLSTCLVLGACHKSLVVNGTTYQGRIINSMCAFTTIQFTDGTNLGRRDWENNGVFYDHVFKLENPCTYNPDGIRYSDTFRFVMVAATPQNCTQCMAFGNTPDVAYSIQIVK